MKKMINSKNIEKNYIVKQDNESYTEEDHEVWRILCKKIEQFNTPSCCASRV